MSSTARVIKQVTVTSAIGAAMLAASASSAWADNSSGASAAAHVRYSVSGTTATITPYLTGTQHEMKTLSEGHVRSVLPQSFSITAPKSATWVSGNAAGDSGEMVCTNTGSVPLMPTSVSATPIVLRFPGPGTYPVTLSADVCTSQGTVTKTVNITIPSASAMKNPTAGTTGMPGLPATVAQKQAAAATGTAKVVGPHVETDLEVQHSDSTMLWGLAGGAGLAALSGGLVAARRRR